jgi:guanylate kinase
MPSAVPLRVDTVEQSFEVNCEGLFDLDFPLLVIGAVSGVGRTSVGKAVQERMGKRVKVMRQFTTRPERRVGEKDRLLFGTAKDYEGMAARGEVLLATCWDGNGKIYSVLKSEIDRARGHELVLFETTGFCWALKSQSVDLVKVAWLVCEDEGTLGDRIRGRGSEGDEEVASRLKSAIRDQRYVLDRRDTLLSDGKLDVVIDTDGRTVDDLADELIREFGRIG